MNTINCFYEPPFSLKFVQDERNLSNTPPKTHCRNMFRTYCVNLMCERILQKLKQTNNCNSEYNTTQVFETKCHKTLMKKLPKMRQGTKEVFITDKKETQEVAEFVNIYLYKVLK